MNIDVSVVDINCHTSDVQISASIKGQEVVQIDLLQNMIYGDKARLTLSFQQAKDLIEKLNQVLEQV